MTAPRVTVLMCVYAGAARVGAAIRSILDQTFTDFELLVIDDASPDDTSAIVESFRDPRVRLLRNDQNLGAVRSANRGLREARGAYIARLDHDDLCAPTRIAREVAVLDAEPGVDVVGTWMNVVDGSDQPLGFVKGKIDSRPHFLFLVLIDMVPIGNSSSMFRRDAALGIGGYDETMGPAEDKDLWRRLAVAGADARMVESTLTTYRIHEGQLSQTRSDLQRSNDQRSLRAVIAKLAPQSDSQLIRSLLSWDDDFWAEWSSSAEARRTVAAARHAIDELVAGATTHVSFSVDEAQTLRHLLLGHVVLQARQSWRRGLRRQWRVAPYARLGFDLPPKLAAASLASYGALLMLAPLLTAARRGKRSGLALLAGHTGKSPRLAALYAWLHNDPWTKH